MSTIINQLKRYAQHTRLSAEEKAAMRNVLIRHIAAHPARASVFQDRSIPSPFSLEVLRSKKSLSALVIGGLLLGGSVSFAAEGAVPGDIFYPIKVRVNEPVRGAFAITPRAKADWGVRLVERRLGEIERIASLPGRSLAAEQATQRRLEEHTAEARKRIANLTARGDNERAQVATEHFMEVLRAHEAVLEDLSERAIPKNRGELLPEDRSEDEGYFQNEHDDSASALQETVRKIRNIRANMENDKKKLRREGRNGDKNENSIVPHLPVRGTAPAVRTLGEKEDRSEEIRTRPNTGR